MTAVVVNPYAKRTKKDENPVQRHCKGFPERAQAEGCLGAGGWINRKERKDRGGLLAEKFLTS
jgi:hypothetical protein